MPLYTYDYNDISFTLDIPEYWHTIYKGKPRERLYKDYSNMLDKLKTVSKDKIVLDIGVNHGIFSIPASMLGYKVVGFEPVLENFEGVERAREAHGLKGFHIYKAALSNENGRKDIYVPECTDNASLNKDAAIANMKGKQYRVENVASIRFDDWIDIRPEYENIGFIKIDVQGGEYNVIEGMSRFLADAHDIYLLVEYEAHLNKMGYSYEQLDSLIASLGFVEQARITGGDKLFYKK